MTGASAGIRAGCQTYTWEMLGNSWSGGPDDLLTAISDGGYAGIEITDDPARAVKTNREMMRRHGV